MKKIDFNNQKIPNEYRPKIDSFTEGVRNDANIPQQIKDNLGMLVATCVYYAKISSLDIADMLQEGVLAMLRYNDSFDPLKGTYATFIRWSVSGMILTFINNNKSAIRDKRQSKSEKKQILHIDALIDYQFRDENKEKIKDDLEYNLFLIKKISKHLNENERKVIDMHFFQQKTIAEIKTELGMTARQISNIKKMALIKMNEKKYLEWKAKQNKRVNGYKNK